MQPLILFVHGFGSCGWGEKSLQLRRHFGLQNVLAPDLPFHPQQALDRLKDLIRRYPVRFLIGSSLGGFYATALNADARMPAVLINPVVGPHRLLSQFLGPQQRWCDDAEFTVSEDYLHTLKQLQRARLRQDERYLVMLQEGDETLDYRQAADFYRDKEVVRIPGGSHRFDDFERQLPRIDQWLKQNDNQYA